MGEPSLHSRVAQRTSTLKELPFALRTLTTAQLRLNPLDPGRNNTPAQRRWGETVL